MLHTILQVSQLQLPHDKSLTHICKRGRCLITFVSSAPQSAKNYSQYNIFSEMSVAFRGGSLTEQLIGPSVAMRRRKKINENSRFNAETVIHLGACMVANHVFVFTQRFLFRCKISSVQQSSWDFFKRGAGILRLF